MLETDYEKVKEHDIQASNIVVEDPRKHFQTLDSPTQSKDYFMVVPVTRWEVSSNMFWLSYVPPNQNGAKREPSRKSHTICE